MLIEVEFFTARTINRRVEVVVKYNLSVDNFCVYVSNFAVVCDFVVTQEFCGPVCVN